MRPLASYPPVQILSPKPVVVVEANGPTAFTPSATVTRPNDTTPYTALDVMGGASAILSFTNFGPVEGGTVYVTEVSFRSDEGAIPASMAATRLHLFSVSPTAIADNAAFDIPIADRAGYLGFVDIPAILDLGATLWAQTSAASIMGKPVVVPTGGTVYGLLQTIAGFTPVAQTVYTVFVKTAVA